jgi:large subunit ribosomal protein L46
MNTWVVGNHPVAHYHYDYPKPAIRELSHHQPDSDASQAALANTYKQQEFGEKVFFMKARIMAGQADVSKSVFGDQEFQWLTKAEIEPLVTPKYWSSVRNMLVER